jgi:hypothetical protein
MSNINKKGLVGKFVKLKSTCKTSLISEIFEVVEIFNIILDIKANGKQYVCFIEDIEFVYCPTKKESCVDMVKCKKIGYCLRCD